MYFRNFSLLCVMFLAIAVQADVWHTVHSGDSLDSLGKRYRMAAREIAKANHLSGAMRLTIGKRLRIPHVQSYTVRNHDTLAVIAKRYGLTAGELARMNSLAAGSRLTIGQSLLILAPAPTTEKKPTPEKTLTPEKTPAPLTTPEPVKKPTEGKGPVAAGVHVGAITVTPATLKSGWYTATKEPVRITVQAEGATRVEFWYAAAGIKQAPGLLGIDQTGKTNFSLGWTVPAHTSWHLWAVAYNAAGSHVSSELINVFRD